MDVFVSLQTRGATDRVGGHLATGLLGAPGTVLIPNPPPILFDPANEFEILVFTADPGPFSPVELLHGWCLTGLHLDGQRDNPFGAVLTLRQNSAHPPVLRPYRADRLTRALHRHHGDLWAALEAVDAIDEAQRDGPPIGLLERLPEIERAQRQYSIKHRAVDGFETAGSVWCVLFCICQGEGP